MTFLGVPPRHGCSLCPCFMLGIVIKDALKGMDKLAVEGIESVTFPPSMRNARDCSTV